MLRRLRQIDETMKHGGNPLLCVYTPHGQSSFSDGSHHMLWCDWSGPQQRFLQVVNMKPPQSIRPSDAYTLVSGLNNQLRNTQNMAPHHTTRLVNVNKY